MAIFKCKMCGGTLEINSETVATCEYCGTQQTLPKLSDDRRANLYDRANHFRRNNEFDKAMGIYEQILNEDNTDAESYWSLVLCRYGIEYVEDPATRKRVPTVNRAQFTSIFDDDNYKSALQYADGAQRHLYEEEAKAINEIQKGILAISQKEEPFDVFICYKETDRNGRRTPDSVLANELYHQLTQEGFKVFFSRITLEDKLGVAYEPYIFAALNSAKVMVVLGTKQEYFNAVWVKNEWSRYLALIRKGANKILIPAYRDMDPYDLPDEFSHLQAQDMSKLGFMQDLIRGIKKLTQTETPKQTVVKETVIASGNANIAPLLKRAFMFLEDGDWKSADEYCEKVLDIDPECAQAYLGKLMAELRVCNQDDLKDCAQPFDSANNYQKAMRFADGGLRVVLMGYIDHINERNEQARMEGIYQEALKKMGRSSTEEEYKATARMFNSIKGYHDAASQTQKCYDKAVTAKRDAIYNSAKEMMTGNQIANYQNAIRKFETISDWKDSSDLIATCMSKIAAIQAQKERELLAAEAAAKRNKKIAMIVTPIVCAVIVFVIILNTVIIPNNKYNDAVALMDAGEYTDAIAIFEALDGHKDSAEMISQCYYRHAMVLLQNEEYGKALSAFVASNGYSDADTHINKLWSKLAVRETISAGGYHTVGLKADGTVVAVGSNGYGQRYVEDWTDIIAISAGTSSTVGLKADGTVVAVGSNGYGQRYVEDWTDIIAISAGYDHTVGLKADGTVVAVGNNADGQCNVEDWTDIIAISAEERRTIGLKADGTVVAVGDYLNTTSWTDIIAISAGRKHTVVLKSDGTVVAVGNNADGQCNVEDWADIIAISAGSYHTVGLKADGTVVAVGNNGYGQRYVEDWTDIIAISTGYGYTVGLKADGTVVAIGYNHDGQCNVSGWRNIKIPD